MSIRRQAGAEPHEQFLAFERHRGDLLEPRPQPLQLAPSHGPFLVDAVAALRQNVEFLLLGHELDVDAITHVLPGQADQRLLHLAEPPFGRADQIGDRRIGLAHLGEDIFGGDAAIHHPDALCLAVLRLDLLRAESPAA